MQPEPLLSSVPDFPARGASPPPGGSRYRPGKAASALQHRVREPVASDEGEGPVWRPASVALRGYLEASRMARRSVTYVREFVDRYCPNETFLLPPALAEELTALGGLNDQQPAGTYMRRVLEPLLVDLSWSSSYLEGNAYTRMATEELFRRADPAQNLDALMLLNHKQAIEFMVDAVPRQGLTSNVIRNVHALLMSELLSDPHSLGTVRHKVVHISGTTYFPCQVPSVLNEMLEQIVRKAGYIKNPIEAAFFLWIQLAYLQGFEDGNKRVSRLAANMPLMLYNQAPLSFLDVTREDYALAMIGIYECNDVSLAVDLFDWTYRRSLPTYRQTMEVMGRPDPFRMKYRLPLSVAMGHVVRRRESQAVAVQLAGVPPEDQAAFQSMLARELEGLGAHNCARRRISMEEASAWIEAGRPQ
ncbi:Fic/DOC family protein [Roseateles sp. YR242]|uniref:Fic family protein n=1 Tax=Roseateles sp. YR242 TaxID=1855305 RepID=UPI0008BDBF37|nr:Fic family protein [Roseateles sp. YR242]SEK58490.1 Fic/DOC family protein [Roseateles sp. YR242]